MGYIVLRLENQESFDLSLLLSPQESIASNPPTSSDVESMKQDEKAPRENKLQGYRKLNREKAVTRKDNSVDAAQYSENYYSQSPGTDPHGPPGGKERVERGGSFRDPGPSSAAYDGSNLRSSARRGTNPDGIPDSEGFRVVAIARTPRAETSQ